jgi:hypothetical protein
MEVFAYAFFVLSTQRPMLSGLKTRFPLDLAADANVVQRPILWDLQAAASARQSSLT